MISEGNNFHPLRPTINDHSSMYFTIGATWEVCDQINRPADKEPQRFGGWL